MCEIYVLIKSSRPQSQGQHDHGEPKSTDERDYLNDFDGVWKGLTALSGIYFLFIVEHCIGMFQHYKDHKVRDTSFSQAASVFEFGKSVAFLQIDSKLGSARRA